MSRKFLVTGGAGFIGSHLAQRLVREGHFVRALDDFSSGREANLSFAEGLGQDRFELVRGSVADRAVCERACEGIDFVLHQAALVSVPESLENPEKYQAINGDGTLFLLRASLGAKVKRFVFASSCAVYGEPERVPQKEDDPLEPMSPYALTKVAGETYCRMFSRLHGLETVCLRYFNVFGPRQTVNGGYAAVIPRFIRLMLNGERPAIFGDGRQSRDFTYVDDVVEANRLAATTPGLKHEVMNAAAGAEVSVLDLVDALNRILGKRLVPEFRPKRAGDVVRSFSDGSKIRRLTGYRPTVGFEEGLRRTVESFR